MKKHISIILSIFAFSICFLSFWYSDTLFNRFFIFGILPLALSILILLIAFIVSIIYTVRGHSEIKNILALLITIATIVIIFVFPFRMAKVRLELPLFEKDRLKVIEMIKNDNIIADHLGNAELPTGYGKLSSDGEIHIYQNDSEQVISFWVFRGMLSGSVELVYSSQDESLIYENESGHPIINITKLKEHWYLVRTDY